MTRVATAACVVVATIAAAWAFVLYGEGRTMTEHFGFSVGGVAAGELICAAYAGPAILGIWTAARLLVPGGLSNSILVAAVAGVTAGCIVSETALLVDEAQFVAEVGRDPSADISRARAWPHGNAGLVYIAGRGIHATD